MATRHVHEDESWTLYFTDADELHLGFSRPVEVTDEEYEWIEKARAEWQRALDLLYSRLAPSTQ